MKYKGYTADIEVDEMAGILFGKVLDIKDVITFQGDTVAKLQQEFRESVDDYLEWCYELDESTEKNVTEIVVKSSVEKQKSQKGSLKQELLTIAQRYQALPTLDNRSAEEILGYEDDY